MTGPPTAPPKVLRINVGRAMPAWLLNQSLAVKMVLRFDSKAAPCQVFEPDLVTNAICAPDDLPPPAPEFRVETRNSSIASEFNRRTGPFSAFGTVMSVWAGPIALL